MEMITKTDRTEMLGLEHIKQIRLYCDYLEDHLNNVRKAWLVLQEACKHMPFVYDDLKYFTINAEIESHDLSKFSPHEFIQYQRKFFPIGERYRTEWEGWHVDEDFKFAWEHHKTYNHHHWEKVNSHADVVHMVCDWMAMSMRFGGTAQQYYEDNKDEIKIPEIYINFLNNIFTALANMDATGESPEVT